MPDAIAAALASAGLFPLGLAYLVAGVIRGFTGFGTALIVVPVAGIYLNPADILLMIGVSGILSNLLLVPEAWRVGDRGEVGTLALAAMVAVPIGFGLQSVIDGVLIRWVVAAVAFVTLVAVVSGWQWRGKLGTGGLTSIGLGAGVVGGLTALTGPIAIMFYLANARRAVAVRANMIMFLGAIDILLLVNVSVAGTFTWAVFWFSIIVSVPYMASIMIGKALFDPDKEQLYRWAAYLVVFAALVTGLPIWT
ncbi:MAG: TSUP family transporter [Pseudomonadota bacterium]